MPRLTTTAALPAQIGAAFACAAENLRTVLATGQVPAWQVGEGRHITVRHLQLLQRPSQNLRFSYAQADLILVKLYVEWTGTEIVIPERARQIERHRLALETRLLARWN